MKTRLGKIRELICRQDCPAKCGRYLSNLIDYDNTDESCPLKWKGQWFSHKQEINLAQNTRLNIIKRATWGELHLRALNTNENDSKWVEDFSKRVSQLGCNCQKHWMELLKNHPPRWNDYFAWTVEAHNLVNKRLNKPQITLEAALKIWLGIAASNGNQNSSIISSND